MYTGIHKHTQVYAGIHRDTPGVHRDTQVYTGIHRDTLGVHRDIQVYTCIRRYTQGYVTIIHFTTHYITSLLIDLCNHTPSCTVNQFWVSFL